MVLIDIPRSSRPLCPNDVVPMYKHPMHIRQHQINDIGYDIEEECPVTARIDDIMGSRMYLYVTKSSISHNIIVEAYFYICPTCGLILPATRVVDV